MRNNGIVTEKAEYRINKKKYDKNYTKIFGERKKSPCDNCDLSTMKREDGTYKCSHCGHEVTEVKKD